jgi:MFS family permease
MTLNNHERGVVGLTGGAHIIIHVVMEALPAVSILLIRQFGLDTFQYGLLANLSYLTFGLISLPAGFLVDRIGARKTLRICLAGIALGALVTALSTTLWMVALGVGLIGLAAGLYHPIGLTMISSEVRQSGRGMGYHGIAGNIGHVFGHLLSAGVLAVAGWPHLFGVSVLLSLGMLSYQVLSERRNPYSPVLFEPTVGQEKANLKQITLIIVGMTFLGFSHRGLEIFMPLYFGNALSLVGLSEEVIGNLATAVVLLGGVSGQFIGGRLADREKPLRSLVALSLGGAVVAGLCGVLGGWGSLVSAFVLAALLFGTLPISNNLIGRLLPAKHRGKGYGLLSTFTFGVGSLVATIGGALAESSELTNVFYLMGGAALLGAVVFYLLSRKTEQSA